MGQTSAFPGCRCRIKLLSVSAFLGRESRRRGSGCFPLLRPTGAATPRSAERHNKTTSRPTHNTLPGTAPPRTAGPMGTAPLSASTSELARRARLMNIHERAIALFRVLPVSEKGRKAEENISYPRLIPGVGKIDEKNKLDQNEDEGSHNSEIKPHCEMKKKHS
ncbi:hypothetical protein EYF80_013542 [Liparis tanakae]|uniref:Uncharacterized protein n=1 Tax=Liparis tanakae TaxID=230148 RepID=A0A4Z2IFR0_9TELE|nr:hypothetical protein EYF80_013542 [Liparis tanakae]